MNAIEVQNLSKAFRIGSEKHRSDTLMGALRKTISAPISNFRDLWNLDTSKLNPSEEVDGILWALKEVSFSVAEGDVIGIVGRNGSGKSTLLKIISRITEPTRGKVLLRGRVSSLLEVGTGFHPDLTGRDNVYLNGTILGMRKSEIDAKFDEIVEFSGVSDFLATPIKRYSSGMKVRLAFAVAAHLEPEVLVIDEVLAVGDVAFQKRCLGKMQQIAGSGRTVLFVSHNMQAVRSLCNRAVLLSHGELQQHGSVDEVVEQYFARNSVAVQGEWRSDNSRHVPSKPNSPLEVLRIGAKLEGNQPAHRLRVTIDLRSVSTHGSAFVAINFFDQIGTRLMQALPTMEPFIDHNPNTRSLSIEIELPPLIPGDYTVGVWIGSSLSETLFLIADAVGFSIVDSPTANRAGSHDATRGYIVPVSSFEMTT